MPAANGSGRRERFRGSRQCLHGDCGEGEAPLRKQDAAPASRQSCDARSRRDGGATSSGRHTCSRSWKSVQAGVMEGTQSALRQQRGRDGAGRQERRGALNDNRGLFCRRLSEATRVRHKCRSGVSALGTSTIRTRTSGTARTLATSTRKSAEGDCALALPGRVGWSTPD